MASEVVELRQPQDGAFAVSNVEEIPSPLARGPFSKLNEPEDARITGSTRSLGRRLLGLNVATRPKPVVRDLGRSLILPGSKARTQVA